MTIVWKNEAGETACEVLDWCNASMRTIDFCDGFAHFTSGEIDKNGYYIERKIPIENLIRIEY